MLPVAAIAGVGVLQDQIDQRCATDLFSHCPGVGLGQGHEGGLDNDRFVETKAERCSHGVDRGAAAVGVAGIVRLAHPPDQHLKTPPISQGGGAGQEKQITARHECRRQTTGVKRDCPVGCQGAFGDPAIACQVDNMVRPEALSPLRQCFRQADTDLDPGLHLDEMTLAVVKADRLYPWIPLQRPRQTGRTVLTAREEHESRLCGRGQEIAHGKPAVGRLAARMDKGNRPQEVGNPLYIRPASRAKTALRQGRQP